MTVAQTSSASTSRSPKLDRVLGFASLVVYGLAYIAPITVLATYGVASVASGGRLVISYALATVAMSLTAQSFGLLAREFPESGSVYTYAARALHPTVGLVAGWALVLDYLLIPVINLILIGLYGASLLPMVPPAAWIVVSLILMTVLNLAGAKTTDRAATIIFAIEVLCVGAFCAAAVVVTPPPATTLRLPIDPHAILQGAGLVALSFLGFDAVTALADEAKNPQRDIPRAVLATCLIAGMLFCGVCALAFRAYPASHFEQPEVAGYLLADAIGGRNLGVVVAVGLLVGGAASGLASQAGAARLLFGMSRQTGLVRSLARVHPTRRTPYVAILVVAVVGLSAFALSLDDAVSLVNFGALVSFLVVNVAVAGHFVGNRAQRDALGLVRYLLIPAMGAISTGALLWGLSTRAKIAGTVWLIVGLVVVRLASSSRSDAAASIDDLQDPLR